MLHRWTRRLALLAALALAAGSAAAAGEDDLLPVEKAFALSASAPTRDTVKFEWKIADGYYLYRGRIKTKAGAGMTLGELTLPPGEAKHDEFLGDVEVYHHAASATQAFTLADPAATTVELTVMVQGCHQEEPKICYPPHPEKLSLSLPAADAAAAAPSPAGGGLQSALGKLGGDKGAAPMDGTGSAQAVTDALPLPPEQAFRFETIATSLFGDTNYIMFNVAEGDTDPNGANASSPLLNVHCRRALAHGGALGRCCSDFPGTPRTANSPSPFPSCRSC